MSVNLSPVAGAAAQFLDNSGNVLTGGKLYTYLAGTTTPAATYTSSLGVTFHSNPIILDAAGRVPAGGEIWLSDNIQYKFVLKDANDVLIATWDNLSGINSNFVNYTVQEEIQTATAGQTVFNLTTVTYAPGTNSLSVFVDGVNQYDGVSYAFVETNATTVTFTAGLHVGALVKFTTAVQTTGNATNASVVVYDPPFTGGVATTVEDKLAQTVSVMDFGAVGDGVTDDTAAIQNAIDAINANGGGEIFIPKGTYIVTQINVSSTSNLRIKGDSAIIKQANSSVGATLVNFRGTLFGSSVLNFTLDSVEFDGNKDNNGGTSNIATYRQDCVYLEGNDITVKNCITHDATDSGIAVLNGTRNFVLNNVSYNNYLLGFRIGSYPSNAITHSVIDGNIAYDNCIPGNDYSSTFTSLTPDGYVIENTTYSRVSNCEAYYTGVHSDLSQSGSGFKFYECYYNTVSNVTAYNCPWQGFHVEQSAFNMFNNGVSNGTGMTYVGTASNGVGNGIFVLNSDDNSFEQFVCNDSIYPNTSGGNGVQILSSGVLTSKRNVFNRVSAKGNNRNGFQIFQATGNSDNCFIACSALSNNIHGFEVRANRTTIDSCLIIDESIGIYLRYDNSSVQTTGHAITNNKFFDNAIGVQTEQNNPPNFDTTIKNNTFNGNTSNFSGYSNLSANVALDGGYATQVYPTVANNAAVSYRISNTRGLVFVQSSTGDFAIASCNYNALIQIAVSTNGVVDATNGTLTGTTGTSGKLTIRVNDGLLYIENRVSSGAKIALTILS